MTLYILEIMDEGTQPDGAPMPLGIGREDMDRLRHAMMILGMTYNAFPPPHPTFRNVTDDHGFWDVYDALMAGNEPPAKIDQATSDAAHAYASGVNARRRGHPGGGTTIPGYKLHWSEQPARCSHSWEVTPVECHAALAALHNSDSRTETLALSGTSDVLWGRWIGFLHHAAEYGGFTVSVSTRIRAGAEAS